MSLVVNVVYCMFLSHLRHTCSLVKNLQMKNVHYYFTDWTFSVLDTISYGFMSRIYAVAKANASHFYI